MSETLDPLSDDELGTLVTLVSGWSGVADDAARIRRLTQAIAAGTRGKHPAAAGQAVQAAASAYRRNRPLELTRIRGGRPFFDVYVGDPAMGEWPFVDWAGIADDHAIDWLALFQELAGRVVVDDAVRRFVGVMFRNRQRRIWMPASRALAGLALTDEPLRAEVAEIWQRCFPSGLGKEWPDGRLLAPGSRDRFGPDRNNAVHLVRHTLHLGCAWIARGGDPTVIGGLASRELASKPLPRSDAADRSVVVASLHELLRGETTWAEVLDALPARAREVTPDEQAEQSLRDVVEALDGRKGETAGAARLAVLARLERPAWKEASGVKRWDSLWSWLETAEWLRARGDEDALSRMRASAEEASDALALRLDGTLPDEAKDAVEVLLPRLQALLTSDLWATTPRTRQAVVFVETLLLLDRSEIGSLPWRRLAARAVGSAERFHAGPVKDVARVDLALHLAVDEAGEGAEERPGVLLRNREFNETEVLLLAGSDNGAVTRDAAIQLERLLRSRATGADQVKLMWRVLQRDPPSSLFVQLLSVIRGTATPLHELVEAVRALDDARGAEKVDPVRIAHGYEQLAEAACRLCAACQAAVNVGLPGRSPARGQPPTTPSSPLDPTRCLKRFSAALGSGPAGQASSKAWLEWLRSWLFGGRGGDDGQDDGVVAWMDWLGMSIDGPSDGAGNDLSAVWGRFVAAVESARVVLPFHGGRHIEELQGATAALRDRLAPLVWPEALVRDAAMRSTEELIEYLEAEDRASRQAHEHVERLMECGDSSRLSRLLLSVRSEPAERPFHSLLDVKLLESAHGFLLNRQRYAEAGTLRQQLQGRLVLPPSDEHVGARLAERMRPILQRGDEQALADLLAETTPVGSKARDVLPLPELRRAHRLLLDRFQLRGAEQLRRLVGTRVSLPSAWSYLTPLIVGAAAGPFLMLDVGAAWDDALRASLRTGRFWQGEMVIVAALLASLALLWTQVSANGHTAPLASARAPAADAPPVRPRRTLFLRVTAVWLAAHAIALLICAFVIVTTGVDAASSTDQLATRSVGACPCDPAAPSPSPTAPRSETQSIVKPDEAETLAWKLALWTSLSVPLGLFLGLILGGRKLTEGE